MNESAIRDLVASNLAVIDPKLALVGVEHEIVLSDGSKSRIDILAKDKFGCYTIIEIKKSNATARSALQQLYQYAHCLKKHYRLRVQQIRCVIASTHWDSLIRPFSEFKYFTEYDSVGVKLEIGLNNTYSVEIMDPPFETGGGDPLKDFVFFEFKEYADRDEAFRRLQTAVKSRASHLNSIFIKVNERSGEVVNPFGFSWTVFESDPEGLEQNLESWSESGKIDSINDPSHPDFDPVGFSSLEDEIRSNILLDSAIVPDHINGEYAYFALHSLNNTLHTWEILDVTKHGPMFDGDLFSDEEIIPMASGMVGSHPYNFVAHTCPQRQQNFNYVRKRLHVFLGSNPEWQRAVNIVLDAAEDDCEMSISIFNTMNFFGVLTDYFQDGETNRIPQLSITKMLPGQPEVHYLGTVIWNGQVSDIGFRQALQTVYPSEGIAMARSVFQHLNEYDNRLFALYGLEHRLLKKIDDKWLSLEFSRDSHAWNPVDERMFTMKHFVECHPELVSDAGRFFVAGTAYR